MNANQTSHPLTEVAIGAARRAWRWYRESAQPRAVVFGTSAARTARREYAVLASGTRVAWRSLRGRPDRQIRSVCALALLALFWLLTLHGCSHESPRHMNEERRHTPPQTRPSVADSRPSLLAPSQPSAAGSPGSGSAEVPAAEASQDELAAIFEQHDAIRQDVAAYVSKLLDKLPTQDAAHVLLLHQLHSTGHFLGEFERWTDEATNGDLIAAAQRQELRLLRQRWRAWELRVVKTMQADGPPREQ